MPLLPGEANIGKNIATEINAGRPPDQAKAIAMRVAGRPKPTGVKKDEKPVRVAKKPS